MGNISEGMKSLSDDILKCHEERKNSMEQITAATAAVREKARMFLNDSRKSREERGKELRKELREARKHLIRTIGALREDFRKKEREVRADLAEAGSIWHGTRESLKSKRAKSPAGMAHMEGR